MSSRKSRVFCHSKLRRRIFKIEQLEDRRLLISDWQNPHLPIDVNNDLKISPVDALLIINNLNSASRRLLTTPRGSLLPYLDTNGDRRLSATDALLVINTLNDKESLPNRTFRRLEGESAKSPAGFISIPITKLPGSSGQVVPLSTTLSIGREEFNEMGIFVADDLSGRVDGILPGEPGYAEAVFNSSQRRVLYSRFSTFRTSSDSNLPAGSFAHVYVLQSVSDNGNSEDHLRARQVSTNLLRVGWEEHVSPFNSWTPAGDRGYDDATVDFQIGEPVDGNAVPGLRAIPNQTINELSLLTIDAFAMDSDMPDDVISYSLDIAPSGATIDSVTGRFSWTPSEAQGPGNFEVVIRATDRLGAFDTERFTVTVLEVNRPPVLQQPAAVNAFRGQSLSLRLNAIDPDLPVNVLSFSLSSDAPIGMTIDAAQGVINWNVPTSMASGSYFVTARVGDASGLTDSKELQFIVGDGNRNPQWITESLGEAIVGRSFKQNLVASDPDNDPLAFSALSIPNGFKINSDSGRVEWTPSSDNIGINWLQLQVDDGRGGKESRVFPLNVVDPIRNRPPVFRSLPIIDATTEISYAYAALADDADLDSISYRIEQGPSGLSIVESTGAVSWIPTTSQLGPHRVSIIADDKRGGIARQEFTIVVGARKDNQAPIFISTPPTSYYLDGDQANGAVSPREIRLSLLEAQKSQQRASITTGSSTPAVDVFLLLDDTLSFAGAGPLLVEQFPRVIDRLKASMQGVDLAFGVGRLQEYNDSALSAQSRPFILSQAILSASTANFSTRIDRALKNTTPGDGGDSLPETMIEALFQTATGVGFDGNGDGTTSESGSAGSQSTQLSPGESGDVPSFNSIQPADRGDGTLGGAGFRRGALPIILVATDAGSVYQGGGPDPVKGVGGIELPQAWVTGNGIDRSPGGRGATPQAAISALVDLGALVIGLGTGSVASTEPRLNLESVSILTGAVNQSARSIPSGIEGDPIDNGDPFYFLIKTDGADTIADGIVAAVESASKSVKLDIDVTSSDPDVNIRNLSGIARGVNPGETVGFDIELTGSKRAQRFDLQFVRAGTNVVLGSIPVVLNAQYEYASRAVDFDGDAVSYRVLHGPDGATIDANTGDLIWKPMVAGIYDFQIQAEDTKGAKRTQSFQVTVKSGINTNPPSISTTPPEKAVVGAAFTYDVDAIDPDGDAIRYFLTEAPSGMTIDANSGMLRWKPSRTAVEGHPVTIVAQDARGARAVQSFVLPVTSDLTNSPPRFVSTPITSTIAGELYRYPVRVNDLDNDELTFDLVYGPRGMKFIPETRELVWTSSPLEAQSENVILRVSDGRGETSVQSFRIDVTLPNRSPVITSTPRKRVVVNTTFSYVIAATDLDGDPITYSIAQAPSGFTLDAESGQASWNPKTIGEYPLSLVATDRKGARSEQSFVINVTAATPNQSPTFASTPRLDAKVASRYAYQATAVDPDDDFLNWRMVMGPVGMTMNDAGILTWTPTSTQLGSHRVKLEVSDLRSPPGTQEFEIVVDSQVGNRIPNITSTPKQYAIVANPYHYRPIAEDPDNDALVWSLREGPSGAITDPQSGEIVWTPTLSQLGLNRFRVAVLDGQGGLAEQSYNVLVQSANTPPQVLSVPPVSAAVGQAYRYQVQSQDIDGDVLSYRLTGPANATSDPTLGLVQWIPDDSQVGTANMVIEVSDGKEKSTQSFTINVDRSNQGNGPQIVSTPTLQAVVGQPYRYYVETAGNSQGVVFRLDTGPVGMTIDGKNGTVSWTPTVSQIGTASITVSAIDAAGRGTVQRFTLNVSRNNTSPTISNLVDRRIMAGTAFILNVSANDVDGDALSFSLDSAPDGMLFDRERNAIFWQTSASNIGTFNIGISVADVRGGRASGTFALTVVADTEPPIVKINASSNPLRLGDPVAIILDSIDNVGITERLMTLNGIGVPLNAAGQVTELSLTAGRHSFVATAKDAAGNSATARLDLDVVDSLTQDGPLVAIDSPTNEATITQKTSITGTVSAGNLRNYRVLLIFEAGEERVLATGQANIIQGELGKIDPTLLANGEYRLRLVGTNQDGKESIAERLIQIDGQLKFGEYRTSYNDLTIPLGGLPISIVRTYDSLDSSNRRDFGFGWSMEIQSARVRTNVPKSGTESAGVYQPYSDNSRVYITLPGGRREGFTFKPQFPKVLQSNLFNVWGSLLGIYEPVFEPDPGNTTTLSVESVLLRRSSNGEYYAYGSSAPYNPENPALGGVFRVRDRSKTDWELDGATGKVRSIRNASGVTISIDKNKISSSLGVKVDIRRDGQERITSIVDPEGKETVYEYDSIGNLKSVTDRSGRKTNFTYNSSRRHFLEEVLDPLNRPTIKLRYDQDGRLLNALDESGVGIKFSYNVDASTETLVDPDGVTTTLAYDARGNLIREINGVGGVTERTFDSNDQLLTQTVFDGVDPKGLTTSYRYDDQGRLLEVRNPAGNSKSHTYDAQGNLIATTDPSNRVTDYRYDEKSRPTSINVGKSENSTMVYGDHGFIQKIVSNGMETQYEYNAAGLVSAIIDALGNRVSYQYDANGRQTSMTRNMTTPTGVRTLTARTEYDAEGRVTKTIDAENNAVELRYDERGRLIERIDERRNLTKYRYDEFDQRIETIFPDSTASSDADNPRVRTVYNEAGRVIAEIDELGRQTSFVYDRGRLIETIFPDDTPLDTNDNPRKKTEYDLIGRVTAEIDTRGNITRFIYDKAGRIVETHLPDSTPTDPNDNPKVVETYDPAGRRTTSTDPLGRKQTYRYDVDGRLTETVFADGSFTSVAFDAAGRVAKRTDQEGKATEYRYDALGRLTTVIDAAGKPTEYRYDELGNVVRQKDPDGKETIYEYDGAGRRTSTVLPLGQRSRAIYDAVGNLISTTDFNGDTITYVYDARNRLVSKNFPDASTVTFAYTPTSALQSATDSRGITTYTYDARDRLTKRTDPDGRTIQHTYDSEGNRNSTTLDSGTTFYAFDEANRITLVSGPGSILTSYQYNKAGELIQTNFVSGLFEKREYDSVGRLKLVETSEGSQVINRFEYKLDKTGQRIGVTETTRTGRRDIVYAYDEVYRLIGESVTDSVLGNRNTTYTYDNSGNRLTRSDSSDGLTNYIYDRNDRLVSEAVAGRTTQFQYDSNGNMLSRTVNATDKAIYDWDFENRMTSVEVTSTSGTIRTRYRYDHDGIKVSQTVNGEETRLMIDNSQAYPEVVEEYTRDGVVKVSYVYGNDRVARIEHSANALQRFYHVDGLGSTRALSDANRIITDEYFYDAFGGIVHQTGTTANRYLFAGESRDTVTNLDYLRARHYLPGTGRFTSSDPFPADKMMPQTLNRFVYALNDPANRIDPSGLFSLSELGTVLNTRSTLSQSLFGQQARFKSLLNTVARAESISKNFLEPSATLRELGVELVLSQRTYNQVDGQSIYQYGRQMQLTGYILIGGLASFSYADIGFSMATSFPPLSTFLDTWTFFFNNLFDPLVKITGVETVNPFEPLDIYFQQLVKASRNHLSATKAGRVFNYSKPDEISPETKALKLSAENLLFVLNAFNDHGDFLKNPIVPPKLPKLPRF